MVTLATVIRHMHDAMLRLFSAAVWINGRFSIALSVSCSVPTHHADRLFNNNGKQEHGERIASRRKYSSEIQSAASQS
jgi:hypothetical protein